MSTKSKIFIGGLVDGTTQRDVEKKFDVFGKIENVWLNRGFGFVQYVEMRDAEDAIKVSTRIVFTEVHESKVVLAYLNIKEIC